MFCYWFQEYVIASIELPIAFFLQIFKKKSKRLWKRILKSTIYNFSVHFDNFPFLLHSTTLWRHRPAQQWIAPLLFIVVTLDSRRYTQGRIQLFNMGIAISCHLWQVAFSFFIRDSYCLPVDAPSPAGGN